MLFLITAGCKKQTVPNAENPAPIPDSFTAKLDIAFGDVEMEALLTKNSADDYVISILSPEIMSALELSYKGGICTVKYDGLNFETELNRFPQAEFGSLLTQAFYDIEQGLDVEVTQANGILTYCGSGERGVFVFTRDAANGNWLEFSIEGAQLNVKFSEFK